MDKFLDENIPKLVAQYKALADEYDTSILYIKSSRKDAERLFSAFLLEHTELFGADNYNYWYPIFRSKFNERMDKVIKNER